MRHFAVTNQISLAEVQDVILPKPPQEKAALKADFSVDSLCISRSYSLLV